MPINIQTGDQAQFVVEFLDSNGELTVPAAGTLTVAYTVNSSPLSDIISLTPQNSFFTGVWGSSNADLGPATWSVSAIGHSTSAKTGNLRIINGT